MEDPTWQGAFNFMDGADQQTEYEYDENGNLTKDLNKNILRITYNLNALTLVSLANGESILLFFKEPSFQLGFPFACVMKPRTFAPSVTTCRINMQH